MRWKKNWYLVHRWLGLLVSLQLLAWSVGGFTFSILDIENVRGEVDMKRCGSSPLELSSVELTPQEAIRLASSDGSFTAPVERVVLRQRRGRLVYELFGAEGKPLASVNATNGEVTRRIGEDEAAAAAVADFAHPAAALSTVLLEGDPPLEFRGGRMPVYCVDLDHPKQPHIYVCPVTGEILKRRNKLWRIFDFFWMLHIMDYGQRTNFNHWLLTTMSVLAITTSASGIVLWWWRVPRLTGRASRRNDGADRACPGAGGR